MKKKIKLSVIVPCYNVEAYLSKCIDSIINNKVKDMEIILINDGSKDKTLEIINEYNNNIYLLWIVMITLKAVCTKKC